MSEIAELEAHLGRRIQDCDPREKDRTGTVIGWRRKPVALRVLWHKSGRETWVALGRIRDNSRGYRWLP